MAQFPSPAHPAAGTGRHPSGMAVSGNRRRRRLLVGLGGGPASGSAERPLTRRIVDLGDHVLLVQRVCRTWPWSWTLSGSTAHFPECVALHLVQWLRWAFSSCLRRARRSWNDSLQIQQAIASSASGLSSISMVWPTSVAPTGRSGPAVPLAFPGAASGPGASARCSIFCSGRRWSPGRCRSGDTCGVVFLDPCCPPF